MRRAATICLRESLCDPFQLIGIETCDAYRVHDERPQSGVRRTRASSATTATAATITAAMIRRSIAIKGYGPPDAQPSEPGNAHEPERPAAPPRSSDRSMNTRFDDVMISS